MTTQYKLSIKLVQFPQILIELNCEGLRKLQMRIFKSTGFQIRIESRIQNAYLPILFVLNLYREYLQHNCSIACTLCYDIRTNLIILLTTEPPGRLIDYLMVVAPYRA